MSTLVFLDRVGSEADGGKRRVKFNKNDQRNALILGFVGILDICSLFIDTEVSCANHICTLKYLSNTFVTIRKLTFPKSLRVYNKNQKVTFGSEIRSGHDPRMSTLYLFHQVVVLATR